MSDTDLNAISHDLYAVRKEKLSLLRAAGEDPFRNNWPQTHTSAQCLTLAPAPGTPAPEGAAHAFGPEVSVAGRVVTIRIMGKASFAKSLDRDGVLHLYFTRDEIGADRYNTHFKKMLDTGDFIGVRGPLFRTSTGEVTVRVKDYALVSKALRPLPEKWHGLTDSDQVYRQRYLDLIVNADSRKRLLQRSRIVAEVRKFLWSREFTEVETPTFHTTAGGAAARPFITHFNALSCEFFLRIALELHLKRCLVGGIDRVFELGRVFRNEGFDRKHSPEFTMLEVYQAYSDHRGMMELVQSLVLHLCETVVGTTTIRNADGVDIELGGKWREVSYKDLLIEKTGDPDWFSRSKADKLAAAREKFHLDVRDDWEDYEVTNEVYGKLIEPFLVQPTFVLNIPKELCPLAKINQADPDTLDVFELCINGQEVAPAYSEQNDPLLQRKMFEAQAGGEVQKVDNDFLEALEHGMPPAGGMGIGIDRLVILLTGAANIRDTILFPVLRPEAAPTPEAGEKPKDGKQGADSPG
ncbi:MAG: lysine--tRNA ligase [Puniceicoccales bacterium]|jgi:lysyl-tRNA synthetase class 2|nr:lysine--tRNA ligase [Puniceicoccales bacterium]